MNIRKHQLLSLLILTSIGTPMLAMSPCNLWRQLRRQNPIVQGIAFGMTAIATGTGLYRFYWSAIGAKRSLENKVQKVLQAMASERTADFILLMIKPNGNCTSEELLEKARITKFLHAIADATENKQLVPALEQIKNFQSGKTLSLLPESLRELIKEKELIVNNNCLNSFKADQWLALFQPAWLNLSYETQKTLQNMILNQISKRSQSRVGGNQTPEIKNKIKTSLQNKIGTMDNKEILNQFVPRKATEAVKYLDAQWQKYSPQRQQQALGITETVAKKISTIKKSLPQEASTALSFLFPRTSAAVNATEQLNTFLQSNKEPSIALAEAIKNIALQSIDNLDKLIATWAAISAE